MRFSASVRVERRGEADVVADVRSEPPMAIRSSGDRILVAGSAAGPLGGDDHLLTIGVGPQAHASAGTVAAQMVLPGVAGGASAARFVVDVGDHGCLDWRPEPTISVVDSTHTVSTTVRPLGSAMRPSWLPSGPTARRFGSWSIVWRRRSQRRRRLTGKRRTRRSRGRLSRDGWRDVWSALTVKHQ